MSDVEVTLPPGVGEIATEWAETVAAWAKDVNGIDGEAEQLALFELFSEGLAEEIRDAEARGRAESSNTLARTELQVAVAVDSLLNARQDAIEKGKRVMELEAAMERREQGIRYYLGMLEDGDAWWHSLGHIESLCKEFDEAVKARAGKPGCVPGEGLIIDRATGEEVATELSLIDEDEPIIPVCTRCKEYLAKTDGLCPKCIQRGPEPVDVCASCFGSDARGHEPDCNRSRTPAPTVASAELADDWALFVRKVAGNCTLTELRAFARVEAALGLGVKL